MALFDRLLHSRRRQAALRHVSSVLEGNVVFVCQGNLCRSPFAEGVFRGLASGLGVRGFTTQSAGFVQPGRVSPREAVAAAADLGIDLAQHRSQLVSPDMLRRAALVVVMSRDQARLIRQRFGSRTAPMILLGDLDPLPSSARDVDDPWGESQEVFDACYARIGRCVDELVRAVTSSASYASASR